MKKFNINLIPYILIATILICGGIFAAVKIRQNSPTPAAAQTKNIYLAFTDEVYDTIQKNYWDKISDEQLTQLYQDASDKLLGKHVPLPKPDKAGLEAMMAQAMADFTIQQKNLYTSLLSANVLNNLPPAGRGALYTQASQQALMYEINNINPTQNLYADLGVSANASPQDIQRSYQQQSAALSKQSTPAAKDKLAKINKAYTTLSKTGSKQLYDAQGIQATIVSKQLSPNIFYMHLVRFSPSETVKEFTDAANSVAGQPASLDTLIFDLRGNIGGYLDIIQQLLGFFIGKDQVAYGFLQQGQTAPYNTTADKLESLDRYKKIIVLIDGQDQSSTELLAAALKKNHIGVLVGSKTFGWGTVENAQPFEIKDQFDFNQVYSVHLVTNLTEVDGQTIEGKGVQPDINTNSKDWKQQVNDYAGSQTLANTVKQILDGKLTF